MKTLLWIPATMIFFVFVGLLVAPQETKYRSGSDQALTVDQALARQQGLPNKFDPDKLVMLKEAVAVGGYNCGQAFSFTQEREDSRGLPFMVACNTGVFKVTIRPNLRVLVELAPE